ncbi:MAG: hypothetical protein PHE67_00675 [Campylobacterales bacterium]|nr:hypothetical protein [Campylobacterales bacterium]
MKKNTCLFLAVLLVSSNAFSATPTNKKKFSSQVERGYKSDEVERGWVFGDDNDNNKTNNTDEQITVTPDKNNRKGQRDLVAILEDMLAIQKEHLKEQKRIRQILEEQFDPKPKLITKADGTKCIANSSADCFDFPLIPEAKRIPVMAEYLSHPNDMQKVSEWKRWFSKYLNHTYDIGKANEYEAAANGSTTFQTDYHSGSVDDSYGYYSVAKAEHNTKIINLFGQKGLLKLRILIGKTPTVDLYALDDIARFIIKHNNLPIELIFFDNASASIYSDSTSLLSIAKQAFNAPRVVKKIDPSLFTAGIQNSPTYVPIYNKSGENISKPIKYGKLSSDMLASEIIEWMVYEKIIDPATLNDSKVMKDVGKIGEDYMRDSYGINVNHGRRGK